VLHPKAQWVFPAKENPSELNFCRPKLSIMYEFLRMFVPAKMKPNKPKKDTNPPKLQIPKPLSSRTHFVNIHKQDNHFRLAEGFLT
jgi:hypothetical protein